MSLTSSTPMKLEPNFRSGPSAHKTSMIPISAPVASFAPAPFLMGRTLLRYCHRPRTKHVTCGLRGAGHRGTLWRSDVPSVEAIQAVQSLKLAKSTPRLGQVLSGKLSRLLKADLLNALAELQRQNQLDLALMVFKHVQQEVWYEPDIELYCGMIRLSGKNNLIEMAEDLFSEMKNCGLEPDTGAYTEMIGAYFKAGMVGKAMETYETMKADGCAPNRLTLTILIRNLKNHGEDALEANVKKECVKYVDSPRQFLEEVERKYPKRKLLDLV